ncbi:hypothetical protein O181_011654 [Austropuccinia psidii MF-1]|uniref:Uncharacterized protein n=1 Tax=Austropuccinia psidii MF-1 TaxID=1389203 RepID=A0A9Q3GM26_9BASI|nr:hypothetical protein [Austropuccinia psidii MF-1]
MASCRVDWEGIVKASCVEATRSQLKIESNSCFNSSHPRLWCPRSINPDRSTNKTSHILINHLHSQNKCFTLPHIHQRILCDWLTSNNI